MKKVYIEYLLICIVIFVLKVVTDFTIDDVLWNLTMFYCIMDFLLRKHGYR